MASCATWWPTLGAPLETVVRLVDLLLTVLRRETTVGGFFPPMNAADGGRCVIQLRSDLLAGSLEVEGGWSSFTAGA